MTSCQRKAKCHVIFFDTRFNEKYKQVQVALNFVQKQCFSLKKNFFLNNYHTVIQQKVVCKIFVFQGYSETLKKLKKYAIIYPFHNFSDADCISKGYHVIFWCKCNHNLCNLIVRYCSKH